MTSSAGPREGPDEQGELGISREGRDVEALLVVADDPLDQGLVEHH